MTKAKLILVTLSTLLLTTACSDIKGNLGDWQAVFLSSGQVYYGKLTQSQGQFYRLTDVYYIHSNAATNPDKTRPPQLTLVKMGNELHGPEDEIIINRDHILYIENLKSDGEVAKKIAEAKAQVEAGTADGEEPAAAKLPSNQMNPEELKQFQKFKEFQAMQQAKAAAEPVPDKK